MLKQRAQQKLAQVPSDSGGATESTENNQDNIATTSSDGQGKRKGKGSRKGKGGGKGKSKGKGGKIVADSLPSDRQLRPR